MASALPVAALPAEPPWDPARFPPAARRNRLQQTALFNRAPLDELARARDRVGTVFSLRLLPYQALVCAADPVTNREVLTDNDRFAAGAAADLIEPIVGRHSLILTPSPQHARNRKLLTPPFHGASMRRWRDEVAALVDDQLPQLLDRGPTAVRPWAQVLTLDVILEIVFGVTDEQRRAAYRSAIDKVMDPVFLPILFAPEPLRRDRGRLSPGGVFARRKAVLDGLVLREIAERRADPRAPERNDVLSVLLGARDDEGRGFADEELLDELKGLVVAGHETTATALAWSLHLLAHHPDALDALVADLDAGSDDYLKATIKESMRLRSPVFDAVRIATVDTYLGGQPVPAGAHVSATFCAMHVDAAVWPDPDAFRPERHLGGKTDPAALTPFGGGTRRCIGAALAQLELEVVLRAVLARARPLPAGPPEAVRLLGVTLIPARGGRIDLVPRPSSQRSIS